MQCSLPGANSSTVDVSLFDRVWKQYLTVPLLLIAVLFPLINFKSPTFFTKLNALGTFGVFFTYVHCDAQFGMKNHFKSYVASAVLVRINVVIYLVSSLISPYSLFIFELAKK